MQRLNHMTTFTKYTCWKATIHKLISLSFIVNRGNKLDSPLLHSGVQQRQLLTGKEYARSVIILSDVEMSIFTKTIPVHSRCIGSHIDNTTKIVIFQRMSGKDPYWQRYSMLCARNHMTSPHRCWGTVIYYLNQITPCNWGMQIASTKMRCHEN